ncbi:MAG: outer membrane beta-barrel protein [Acidobacteriota bacterium]
MKKRAFKVLSIASLCLVSGLLATAAHAGGVEITPFVGQRFGGEFTDEFADLFFDIEVDDGESTGVAVAFDTGVNWQLELMWSHQESELVETGFLLPDLRLFDIDVDYYHVGMLYQWRPGQIQPFVVGSIGATNFGPGPSDLSDETRPSVSLGGGVKIMFNEHFGLRFEARGFSTIVETDDDIFCDEFLDDCRGYDDEYFFQGEARAGLVLRF